MARGHPARPAGRATVPATQASPRITNGSQAVGRGTGAASPAARPAATNQGGADTRRIQRPLPGGYARANRHKPSGIAAKETVLDVHLLPALGATRLNDISTEQVQRFKHRLQNRTPKTVNNVLTVLNVLLRKAVEWGVIERKACTIRLLSIPRAAALALLASGDAWSARTGHSGAGRASGLDDDSAAHSPEPGGDRGRDSVARHTLNPTGCWQHVGNGIDRER